MPIETITFKGLSYPAFQAEGNAAQFILPFAQKLCKGVGVDIGPSKAEWSLPGSIIVESAMTGCHTAQDFPHKNLDYIFSSHCLEHIPEPFKVLEYWITKLKKFGVLFLYLPSYNQEYWRPWNNKKHVNIFHADMLVDFLEAHGFEKIMASGVDLNHSFCVVGQK